MVGITRRAIDRLVTEGFQIGYDLALMDASNQEVDIFRSPQIPVRLQSKSTNKSVVDSRLLKETDQTLEYRLNIQG